MSDYKCHVFVCTKCRYFEDENKEIRCPKDTAEKLRDRLKSLAKDEFGKKQVRINKSGCLGECESGITVVAYPQNIWFLGQTIESDEKLLSSIRKLVSNQNSNSLN